MFDLHILHLPALNLLNINLYSSETHSEKALRCGAYSLEGYERGYVEGDCEEKRGRMREIISGR